MVSNIQRYMDSYRWFRNIIDSRFKRVDDEVSRDLICRVLAKYRDELRNVDIEKIISDIIDHYDKVLGRGELKDLVENIVLKYIDGKNRLVKFYENLSKKDKLLMERDQLIDGIDFLKEQLMNSSDEEYKRELVNQIWDMHCKVRDLDREIERIENNSRVRKTKKNKVKRDNKIVIKKVVKKVVKPIDKRVNRNMVKRNRDEKNSSVDEKPRLDLKINGQNSVVYNPLLNRKIDRKYRDRMDNIVLKDNWFNRLMGILFIIAMIFPIIMLFIMIITGILLKTNITQ